MSTTRFVAIYVTLVTTDFGLGEINKNAPEVAVCATHTLETKSTIFGMADGNPSLQMELDAFLNKYSSRLSPSESYIATNPAYLMHGYKNRGLMLGFEHSIPDATLPIFWSPGTSDWEPLIERNSPTDTATILRQLFGDNRAEWASVHFKDLFVSPTYLKKLESVRPCFLVGGRGTGKTDSPFNLYTTTRCCSGLRRWASLRGSRALGCSCSDE